MNNNIFNEAKIFLENTENQGHECPHIYTLYELFIEEFGIFGIFGIIIVLIFLIVIFILIRKKNKLKINKIP